MSIIIFCFTEFVVFLFFLLSFSLDEKETKNQGKKMLPRTSRKLSGLGWPAFLPTQRTSVMGVVESYENDT
jgi:predicted PurR-regulated permease PerM